MARPEVPVRRMVLYKHGVGYIERSGPFSTGDPMKLHFKKGEMDDILKSLTVFASGKGKIAGVSYETGEDVERILAEKALRLPEGAALAGLFSALKGYRIRLGTPAETMDGTVVGTEEPKKSGAQGDGSAPSLVIGDREREKRYVLVRNEGGEIRPFDMDSVSAVKILDSSAEEDLNYYLEAVTSERKKEEKGMSLFFAGGEGQVTLSYITQFPSWRVSYRLAHTKEKTLVQGWGIIDNNLDEDLKEVRLSLVAGKPISFIYDIYTPRTVDRPVVREEVRTMSSPVELEAQTETLAQMQMMPAASAAPGEGGEYAEMDMLADEGAVGGAAMGRRAMMAKRAAPAAPPPPPRFDSARVQTKAVEMGEFFRYDIDEPVTVKRGQSAMVPIIQGEIECRKEHVYNGQKVPRNPVVALRLKNSTGLVLERGPVVVLEEGTYVGEAILPYTTMQSEAHLPYAVDMGVVVTESPEYWSEMKGVSIAKRYFHIGKMEMMKTVYEIENRKTEKVDIVIEHPKRSDHEFIDTPKAKEETESFHRFAVEMPPKSSKKLEVKEGRKTYEQVEIVRCGIATVKEYLNRGFLSKDLFSGVDEILKLVASINRNESRAQELERSRERIFQEQARLRENIKVLGKEQQDQALRGKYLKTFEEQEKSIEKINAEVQHLRAENEKINATINEKLEELAKRAKAAA